MDPDPLSIYNFILTISVPSFLLLFLGILFFILLTLLSIFEQYVIGINQTELEKVRKENFNFYRSLKFFYEYAYNPSASVLFLKVLFGLGLGLMLLGLINFIENKILLILVIFTILVLAFLLIPLLFKKINSTLARYLLLILKPFLLLSNLVTNLFSEPSFANKHGDISIQDISNALPIEEKTPNLALYRQIIRFDKIRIRQVMRPKTELQGIKSNYNFKEVLQKINATQFSRLPVYEGNWNKPLGIIHCKDLLPFTAHSKLNWKKYIRPVFFVNEGDYAQDILRRFQQTKNHMALVHNKNKRIIGLVTLEDITEEIIGEIEDE